MLAELLLHHWYATPVPAAVTDKAVSEPLRQTPWVPVEGCALIEIGVLTVPLAATFTVVAPVDVSDTFPDGVPLAKVVKRT